MYSCKRQKHFLLILRGKLKKIVFKKAIFDPPIYINFDICSHDYSIVLRIIGSCLANYIQPRLSRIYVLIYFDFENLLPVDQHTLVSYIRTENVGRQFEDMFF